MKKKKTGSRRGPWLIKNEVENHATTFSNNPQKDRDPLIGRTARTTTALHPTGEIELNGRNYDAVAEGNFIDPFRNVRITGTRDFRLTVEMCE